MLSSCSFWWRSGPSSGALIVSRHPRHPIGWLLCLGLLPGAIEMFVAGFTAYDQLIYPGSLPGIELALIWSNWSGFPFSTTAFTLLLLLFPDGKLASPARRRVAWAAIGGLLPSFATTYMASTSSSTAPWSTVR